MCKSKGCDSKKKPKNVFCQLFGEKVAYESPQSH